MHTSTSPRRKSFRLWAALGTSTVALGSLAALMAGVTPAQAANMANQPDMQVMVFMLPLTLLVLALLFEAARFVRRGALPAQSAARPSRRLRWSQDPRGD